MYKHPPVLREVHRSVWRPAVDLEKMLELVWLFDREAGSHGFSSQTCAGFLYNYQSTRERFLKGVGQWALMSPGKHPWKRLKASQVVKSFPQAKWSACYLIKIKCGILTKCSAKSPRDFFRLLVNFSLCSSYTTLSFLLLTHVAFN